MSPPNTPKTPPEHLCRGVNFELDKHPRALNLIDLKLNEGYGWRGPSWKYEFNRYNYYEQNRGIQIYKRILHTSFLSSESICW